MDIVRFRLSGDAYISLCILLAVQDGRCSSQLGQFRKDILQFSTSLQRIYAEAFLNDIVL